MVTSPCFALAMLLAITYSKVTGHIVEFLSMVVICRYDSDKSPLNTKRLDVFGCLSVGDSRGLVVVIVVRWVLWDSSC